MSAVTAMHGKDERTSWGQRFEVAVILWLNRFFPPPGITVHTEDAARKARTELEQDDFTRGQQGAEWLAKWTSFEHRVVLDLGCGQGFKTTGYAASAKDIRLVVGVDVDAKALETARECSRRRRIKRVTFVMADAGALPLKDRSIDIVTSMNAFEHVPQPQAALQEAGRVLRDQGILWLQFFPLFYSRFGAHLWDYLHVPWAHVWASPRAVTEAYRTIIETQTPRLLREFAGQYDEQDIKSFLTVQIKQFMTLNRLTPRTFYRAVAATGGWRILHFSFFGTSRLERLLAYCPGLDRVSVWGIDCLLRRDRGDAVSVGALIRFRWREDLKRVRVKLAVLGGKWGLTCATEARSAR